MMYWSGFFNIVQVPKKKINDVFFRRLFSANLPDSWLYPNSGSLFPIPTKTGIRRIKADRPQLSAPATKLVFLVNLQLNVSWYWVRPTAGRGEPCRGNGKNYKNIQEQIFCLKWLTSHQNVVATLQAKRSVNNFQASLRLFWWVTWTWGCRPETIYWQPGRPGQTTRPLRSSSKGWRILSRNCYERPWTPCCTSVYQEEVVDFEISHFD